MSDTARHWVVAAYTLTFGGFLLVGGRLADLLGRKRVFLVGVVGFAAMSLLGGLAQGPVMLPLARAAQGVFAALIAPAGLAILATAFQDPRERAKAFGVFGAAVGSGMAVGMVLGGVLTDLGSWRWCLLINLPLAAAVFLPATRVLAESKAGAGGGLYLPGALTATSGVGSAIYGISRAEVTGWTDPLTAAAVALGVVLLIVFVLIERRAAQPMMPLPVVLDRVRGAGYLVVFLAGAALLAFYLLLAYYLQNVRGYAPLATGLIFVPSGLGIFIGSLATGKILPRTSPRLVMAVGLALGAAGFAVLAGLTPDTGVWSVLIPAQLISGVGIGAALTTVTKMTVDGVDPKDAGVASALTNATRQIGGAVGVSALNAVALSVTADAGAAELTDGYSVAFLVGALLLVAALVVALPMTGPRRA